MHGEVARRQCVHFDDALQEVAVVIAAVIDPLTAVVEVVGPAVPKDQFRRSSSRQEIVWFTGRKFV